MIVFDLQCESAHHVFEAWFGSSEAYEDQRKRSLIACPYCGETRIDKAVMSPRIGTKTNQRSKLSDPPPAPNAVSVATNTGSAIEALAKAQAAALETSKWVGADFDDQARAMDAGELPHATIHGQATVEQARALINDGIAVIPIPFPVIPPNQRN